MQDPDTDCDFFCFLMNPVLRCKLLWFFFPVQGTIQQFFCYVQHIDLWLVKYCDFSILFPAIHNTVIFISCSLQSTILWFFYPVHCNLQYCDFLSCTNYNTVMFLFCTIYHTVIFLSCTIYNIVIYLSCTMYNIAIYLSCTV